MRVSLLTTVATIALLGAAGAQAQLPSSGAIAGSFSGVSSSSGAGSHGTGAAASGSSAGNVGWGTSHVTAGADSGNPLGTHNTVDTSSGSLGGTSSFGFSAGNAGGGGHGSQGGFGFGAGVSYIPNNQQNNVSDRRLKQDVVPLGELRNGLKLYSWRYLGGSRRFAGVMAQDLLLDARFNRAVEFTDDGIMRVDYAELGLLPPDAEEMAEAGEIAVAAFRATLH